MRNYWTDKRATKKYLELLTREISSLCGADPVLVRATLEKEVAVNPFTPEEVDQFISLTDDEIIAEARRIHAFLTNDSSCGLW
jgi:hypothetical protein